MIYGKTWSVGKAKSETVKQIAEKTGVSNLLARIFASRGIEDAEVIKEFLNPSYENLHDPFLLNDMEKAVNRIIAAIENKEKIFVFGDYDVDGITSTSVLYNFLKTCNADVGYYIPDRFEEGYGLSVTGIDRVKTCGAALVITVDCGTTAFTEAQYAKDIGLEVIITDHHECREEIPQAVAVINPCRHDSSYPFRELAGVGVVFKLVNAICTRMGYPDGHTKYLDMVAIGTIADVVPLIDENRIIAGLGLQMLKEPSNTGLKVLIENCGLMDKQVTSWSVSFVLAPRINAAGRMGSASRAVELFTTNDRKRAADIILELSEDNRRRQEIEAEILTEALNKIESDSEIKKSRVIIAYGNHWHHGIIGIVAAKITERYYRPCILISVEDNGVGKGSCRSIEGFDIFDALKNCETLLERYGGHEMAAGLTINTGQIDEFAKMINEYAEKNISDEVFTPKIKIDIELNKEDLSIDSVRQLELLAPFGAGNPSPVFMYRNLKVNQTKKVGDDKHLKAVFEDQGFFVDAIGFNMGSFADAFNRGDLVEAAYSLEINTWNSMDRLQMNLRDLRLCDETAKINNFFCSLDKSIDFLSLNDDNKYDDFFMYIKESQTAELQISLGHIIPEREDLISIFQYVKSNCAGNNLTVDDLTAFSRKIAMVYDNDMNCFKLIRSFEIFHELGIMSIEPDSGKGFRITLSGNSKEKKNLESSRRFMKLQSYKKC